MASDHGLDTHHGVLPVAGAGAGAGAGADNVAPLQGDMALTPEPRTFPTHGDVGMDNACYYVLPPLDGHKLVTACSNGKWTTLIGPRQQGKTSAARALLAKFDADDHVRVVLGTITSAACALVGNSAGDLMRIFLTTALGGPTHDECPTAAAVLKWHSSVVRDPRARLYLLLDEFDALRHASPQLRSDFLGLLRSWKLGNKTSAVAIGGAGAMRVSGLGGSPFNSASTMIAPPFSEELVGALLRMAVTDDQLPQTALKLAGAIHAWCAGHRGMVCMCAENMRLAHVDRKAFDFTAYTALSVRRLVRTPLVTMLQTHLAALDAAHGAGVVSAVVARAALATADHPLELRDTSQAVVDTAMWLSDDGFLATNDDYRFTVTSPLFAEVLKAVLVARGLHGRKPQGVLMFDADTESRLDMQATLMQCLRQLSGSALATMSVLSCKSNGLALEQLYHAELYTVLRNAAITSGGLTVYTEAKAGRQNADLVLAVNSTGDCDDSGSEDAERFLVKLVAHGRPGPATRQGSVAQHYVRAKEYAVTLKIPLANVWLLDFELTSKLGHSPGHRGKVMQALQDAGHGADGAELNCAWLYHSADYSSAQCCFDLAGAPWAEQEEPMAVTWRA